MDADLRPEQEKIWPGIGAALVIGMAVAFILLEFQDEFDDELFLSGDIAPEPSCTARAAAYALIDMGVTKEEILAIGRGERSLHFEAIRIGRMAERNGTITARVLRTVCACIARGVDSSTLGLAQLRQRCAP